MHQRAQQQRLASRPGTKIHHHLAAARSNQIAQQLAAFILDLEFSFQKRFVFGQHRLVGQPDAHRGVWRGGCSDTGRVEHVNHFIALCKQRVDAQIQRCRAQQRLGQPRRYRFAIDCQQALRQPIRHIPLHRQRLCRQVQRLDLRHHIQFRAAQMWLQLAHVHALHAHQPGQRQLPGRAFASRSLQRALAAQHAKHQFRDKGAILVAQHRVFTKIAAQYRVSWRIQRQHRTQRGNGLFEGEIGIRHGFYGFDIALQFSGNGWRRPRQARHAVCRKGLNIR